MNILMKFLIIFQIHFLLGYTISFLVKEYMSFIFESKLNLGMYMMLLLMISYITGTKFIRFLDGPDDFHNRLRQFSINKEGASKKNI